MAVVAVVAASDPVPRPSAPNRFTVLVVMVAAVDSDHPEQTDLVVEEVARVYG